MLTRKQLVRFVRIRNKSGLRSNLQFCSDAEEAGFYAHNLGNATRFDLDGHQLYQWTFDLKDEGPTKLIEFGHSLYLEGEPYADEMFAHMDRATPIRADIVV